jgi:predicted RNase H-like HicB family nuclease
MAIALTSLKTRSEALQNFQQAQQIYVELQLENNVKDCQTAIAQL